MKVSEIIKLLDTEENKYGGATGKERELNLSVNGDFVGNIKSAKLDGWGDGLITDVTLEVEVSSIKYHDEEIRNKVIDDFIRALNDCDRYVAEQITHCLNGNIYPGNEVFVVNDVYKIAEKMQKEGVQ